MLTSMGALEEGDWIIQNASNSAVGRFIIKLAKRKNLNVIGIMRRDNVVEMLKADGAEVIIVADEKTDPGELSKEMMLLTRGAPQAYEGITEMWWRSRAALEAASALEAGRVLLEGERRFIDLSRSPVWLNEVHDIVTGE